MTAKKRAIIAIATVFVIALAGAAGWWISTKGLVGAEVEIGYPTQLLKVWGSRAGGGEANPSTRAAANFTATDQTVHVSTLQVPKIEYKSAEKRIIFTYDEATGQLHTENAYTRFVRTAFKANFASGSPDYLLGTVSMVDNNSGRTANHPYNAVTGDLGIGVQANNLWRSVKIDPNGSSQDSNLSCADPTQPGVYLYDGDNGNGDCVRLTSNAANLGSIAPGAPDLDRRVSSFKIVGNYKVTFYRELNLVEGTELGLRSSGEVVGPTYAGNIWPTGWPNANATSNQGTWIAAVDLPRDKVINSIDACLFMADHNQSLFGDGFYESNFASTGGDLQNKQCERITIPASWTGGGTTGGPAGGGREQPQAAQLTGLNVSPTSGQAPLAVTASITLTNASCGWKINWGDGTTDGPFHLNLATETKTHTYNSVGSFNVSVAGQVIQEGGQTVATACVGSSQPVTVTVSAAPGPTPTPAPSLSASTFSILIDRDGDGTATQEDWGGDVRTGAEIATDAQKAKFNLHIINARANGCYWDTNADGSNIEGATIGLGRLSIDDSWTSGIWPANDGLDGRVVFDNIPNIGGGTHTKYLTCFGDGGTLIQPFTITVTQLGQPTGPAQITGLTLALLTGEAPLPVGGRVNATAGEACYYQVDWGDNTAVTFDEIAPQGTQGNQLAHTYSNAGNYTVTASGENLPALPTCLSLGEAASCALPPPCGGRATASITVTAPVQPPTITSFTAEWTGQPAVGPQSDAYRVDANTAVTFRWTLSSATSCRLLREPTNGEEGVVSGSESTNTTGSVQYTVTESANFRVACGDNNQPQLGIIALQVGDVVPPPDLRPDVTIIEHTVNWDALDPNDPYPLYVYRGDRLTLHFQTVNARQCYLSDGNGNRLQAELRGITMGNPNTDGIATLVVDSSRFSADQQHQLFYITCSNDNGSITRAFDVIIQEQPVACPGFAFEFDGNWWHIMTTPRDAASGINLANLFNYVIANLFQFNPDYNGTNVPYLSSASPVFRGRGFWIAEAGDGTRGRTVCDSRVAGTLNSSPVNLSADQLGQSGIYMVANPFTDVPIKTENIEVNVAGHGFESLPDAITAGRVDSVHLPSWPLMWSVQGGGWYESYYSSQDVYPTQNASQEQIDHFQVFNAGIELPALHGMWILLPYSNQTFEVRINRPGTVQTL